MSETCLRWPSSPAPAGMTSSTTTESASPRIMGDGVVDAPAKDVRYRTIFAWRRRRFDRRPAISGERSRATGHEFADGGAFVLLDQNGADTDKREPRRDIEVLGGPQSHVAGMRFDGHEMRS